LISHVCNDPKSFILILSSPEYISQKAVKQ
jgi:hypothetical protein